MTPLSINGETVAPEEILRVTAEFADSADPESAARRALALRTLLLQRARSLNIPLDDTDEDDAIDALLERELATPEPTPEECRRYFEANSARFRSGDLFEASHILFAVTPNAPVEAIRRQAEETLLRVLAAPGEFGRLAREMSNCPSGQMDGNLGQLDEAGCVPEFFAALAAFEGNGIVPRLVNTRYGFHIVRIDRRIAGQELPFEAVAKRVADFLKRRVRHKAFQQYVRLLAGQARIVGAEIESAHSPLMQ